MGDAAAESRLWDFSVRTYRREGVADACLWLQDRHGLDVSFVLFLVWTGRGRGALEGERFERALAFSRAWSEGVVAGLRAARRWLKEAGRGELAAADPAACRSLRDAIVAEERRAEKLELEALERMVAELPAARLEPSGAMDAARANLELYLSSLAIAADREIEARIAVVLEGALS